MPQDIADKGRGRETAAKAAELRQDDTTAPLPESDALPAEAVDDAQDLTETETVVDDSVDISETADEAVFDAANRLDETDREIVGKAQEGATTAAADLDRAGKHAADSAMDAAEVAEESMEPKPD